MASSESGDTSRDLELTPTWVVACVGFILIFITLETSLHKVGMWLRNRRKKYLLEALEKVKVELMILGFISLLLNFGQSYMVRICIPAHMADTLLPCPSYTNAYTNARHKKYDPRYLSEDATPYRCKERHKPLISVDGLHQLHILIFFLAVLHVIYSAVTMFLGRLKIRGWKAWEAETSSYRYEFANDPSRLRLTHETSFVRQHATFWAKIPILFYISCFFRQFYRSVDKVDYLTLRKGFITIHLSPGSKFNFQKYIKRSLEDDFKVVVGVSPLLWVSFVLFILLNFDDKQIEYYRTYFLQLKTKLVNPIYFSGWHLMFWASLISVAIILAVGTKLQAILGKMATEITRRHVVIQGGIPLVQGSDKYFWFGRPQLLLHLMHFALFQNAFQITYFLWIWYSFGQTSCFNAYFKIGIVKVALGVGVLCLCSYITLPLYALVTQMGSTMKKSIFEEQTSKALKKWHTTAKKKYKLKLGKSSVRTLDGSTTNSTVHSTTPTLLRFKTTGHSIPSVSSYNDQVEYHFDIEFSPTSPPSNLLVRVDDVEEDIIETVVE